MKKFKEGNTRVAGRLEAERADEEADIKSEIAWLNRTKSEAQARGASGAELNKIDQNIALAQNKLSGVSNVARYAQEKADRIKGIKKDDVNKRKSEIENEKQAALEAEPVIARQRDYDQRIREIKKKQEEANRAGNTAELQLLDKELADIGRLKTVTLESAENKKKEIEKEFEERKALVQTREGIGDARKEAFTKSVEKSVYAKYVRGYNYAAAAKIRGGKSAKDDAAAALKRLAKESGVEVEESTPKEEPQVSSGTTPTT